ncbi:MAG: undecaprenyldiphospho-muramoylpentapeptide beta-N-acetylglucosaminyltransferase [Acidobacteria bacterium]|nr:undecaprenyldiphospho-muramoylpentapeptide beta-N-acetylglucosaminyltransferase [Acidobacteriota bacterium]
MRLLLAAGGTGGHVIPALVVAREFCARDAARQVLFVGTARGVETKLVPQAGFSLELLEVGALQGEAAAARLKTLLGLPGAFWRAIRILNRFRPDVVLGVGGYAAGPVMLAAGWLGIPVAVLEPNAFPGLANRWAAPYVARALLAFPETASYFAPGKAVVTGVPVRKEFFEVPPTRHQPPYTVLVFGGSQGARTLNRAVVEALPFLAQAKEELLLLHQTGEKEYNLVREACAKHSVQAEVFPYTERMSEAFARADLVVCRAGANTVAELAAAGRAAILVPYPSAANQHQLRNAEVLVRIGAARLILNQDLNGERFFTAVRELLHNPAELERMETAIRRLAHPEAACRIVDELERLNKSEPCA